MAGKARLKSSKPSLASRINKILDSAAELVARESRSTGAPERMQEYLEIATERREFLASRPEIKPPQETKGLMLSVTQGAVRASVELGEELNQARNGKDLNLRRWVEKGGKKDVA